MSGGAFDYACFKAVDTEAFTHLEQFKEMERYLRGMQKHDAADEVLSFILTLETAIRRVERHGKHVYNLLHATEWAASGDSNPTAIDKAYEELTK